MSRPKVPYHAAKHASFLAPLTTQPHPGKKTTQEEDIVASDG